MEGHRSADSGVAADADAGLIAGYDLAQFYDEMFASPGVPRPHYRALHERLSAMTQAGLEDRMRTANAFFQTRESDSRSTATTPAPTGSFPST